MPAFYYKKCPRFTTRNGKISFSSINFTEKFIKMSRKMIRIPDLMGENTDVSYTKKGGGQIGDNLIFHSPACLLMEKALISGTESVIAKLFRMVNLADNAGYGFDKMLKWEKATKTKVVFDNSIDIALVTFRIPDLTNENRIKKDGGQIGGQIGGAIGGAIVLPESQEKILELIENNKQITRRKISETLEINQSAVQKHLNTLKKKGIVERIGGTRGYWKIHSNE